VTWEDGVWSIQDLGSSNGTYVLRDDFERVESSTIENGDEIALGNARFVFRLT
jgi:pSer/pThr/pTyr-binding forkhead associated (FHA) protein